MLKMAREEKEHKHDVVGPDFAYIPDPQVPYTRMPGAQKVSPLSAVVSGAAGDVHDLWRVYPMFRRTVLRSSSGPCYQRDLPLQGIVC